MTKFFKGKNKVKEQEPRDLKTLTELYQKVLNMAAQSQYQMFVYREETAQLNRQLLQINQEAAKRQALDKAAAPKEDSAPVNEETTSV